MGRVAEWNMSHQRLVEYARNRGERPSYYSDYVFRVRRAEKRGFHRSAIEM